MEHRGTLKRSQRQSCSQSFEEELDSNLEGTVDTSNSGFILNSTPENSPRPLFSCHNSNLSAANTFFSPSMSLNSTFAASSEFLSFPPYLISNIII